MENTQATFKQLIDSLEAELRNVREVLDQLERDAFNEGYHSGYDHPVDVLEHFLQRSYVIFLVVLERQHFISTREYLMREWEKLSAEKGLRAYSINPDYDSAESKPYYLLKQTLDGLKISLGVHTSDTDRSWTVSKLEELLQDTPQLMHRRGKNPCRELDIHEVMFDYLGAFFPTFRPTVRITGTLKDYIPDGAIRELRTAIEFKFVSSEQEAAVAISGLFEDLSGYKDSSEWHHFYAVVYQTQPFKSQRHYESEFERVGAKNWKVFVVNGSGGRKKKLRNLARTQSSD